MWSVLSIIRITVFIVGFICYWRLEDQTLAIAQRAKKMNHEFDGHRDLVTQIKEIDHYYQSLSIEVDNRALNLTAVDCLSLPNHSTALSSSTECPEAVSNAWNWLEKAAKCLQTHLANAANYHKFFHESRHLSSSLPSALTRSKQLDTAQYRLNRHEECIRKIIEEIKEILENLLQIQAKVDILCDQSDAIVPVHLRKLPVTAPLPIVALTSYSRNQIRIDENVSYVLLDNTDPEKWKVKTGDDTTAILPSLIFIIPPPDSEAVQTGSRLRQQFLSTWKTCASVLKFHARTVLSQYLSGHNKRELNYLNKEQITFISECLGEALALLMDNKAQTNDVLDFKKMTDDWTQSISALKPSSNDNRNMTNRLQDDWTVNKKLLRQIQEFEAFVKSYEEDQSSLRAMKQKLIKGDISNLKYVSVAYIESWPKKRFGGPVEDGTPGSSRLIMSEKGPRHSGRYVSQLEAELEEFMSETIMQDQEVSEVTSQTIQETKRFMIRGVIDPRTSQEISIYQAIADKVINHHQGLYRNLVTGESIPIPEAMDRGLILVEYINRSVEMGELIKSGIIKTITSKETVSYHVLSIKDPTTGLKISVSEALRRGIVDPERSRYVINSKTGEAISIPTAIDKGFLEVEVIERKQVGGDAPDGLVNGEAGKDLLVEGVYDPLSRKTLTLNEAVGRGVIDLERGAYFNPVTKDGMSIEEAIQRGYLSVRLADPNARDSPYSPLLGRRMTAVNGRGVGDFEQMVARKSDILMAPMRVSIEQKVRGLKELEARHVRDPSTGKKLTVAEAMDSGLLSLDPLGFTLPDGKKCTIFEAAQQGLIDPQTTKEILKLLEPHRLERYISDGVIDAARGQYVDPTTGERMSLAEAVSRGKLDAGNIFYTDNLGQSVISLKMAAANNRFDLETGQVIDPLTGKKLTLAEAIGRNLINPDVDVEEMSARLSSAKALDSLFKSNVRGIKNPQTGQEISLEDAVYEGILDATKAEFVHPVTKKRIPLTEAAALGLVSPETTKKILDSMSQSSYEDLIARKEIDVATGKFIDPETKRKISMKEAIAKGYLDPGSIYLFDISENRPVSLSTLIAQGKFNPETGKFRDPSSGSEMSVTAAVKQGTVATRFGAEDVVDGKKALQDLLDSRKLSQNSAMFVLPSGDLVPLKEALANGLVSSETAVKLDQKTGNVVLADGSDAVVQALTDTNSRLKFVNEIESQISRQPPVSDNVNDLRQAIPTIEGLKGSLECERKDIEAVLANAQRLVDADKGSPQQNQRLKCNTTDLRMRFEEANVQLDGRLSRLKSLIGDLTHLDNDCRQLGGWTERRNEELDEFRRKLKTASDFEAVKNHLKDFNEELQREEAILQKVNSDGKKVTDAIKECNRDRKSVV